ncbi:DUF4291 family protein [Flavobacterium sp.]|uniref:DUF4291 family protein n=1 Tax=Flavobacterium sp. TaxID=239 RepID=UPI004033605A
MKDWIVQIDDITPFCREVHQLVGSGRVEMAKAMLPVENIYSVPEDLARRIKMTD